MIGQERKFVGPSASLDSNLISHANLGVVRFMLLGFNHGMKTLLMMLFVCAASVAVADNPYTVEAAIYKIEVVNGNQVSSGTGVLVTTEKILTNCHVVEGGGWPRVMNRKTGSWFKVAKYYQLGKLDACVLVGSFSGTPVRFSSEVVQGENVWVFGFPSGLPVVGQGSVKGFADGGKTLLLGAFCAKGSSGGPVVNVKGELIGLNFAVYQYQNQCLSIPASLLQPYLVRHDV